jgi:hypothetical protein
MEQVFTPALIPAFPPQEKEKRSTALGLSYPGAPYSRFRCRVNAPSNA